MVARAAPRPELIPLNEYLEFDRKARWKYEFFRGMVWPVGEPDRLLRRGEILDILAGKRLEAMAGGSSQHSAIIANITVRIGSQLVGKSCRPFNGDLKVRLSETGMYCYPDFTVACPPIEIDDEEMLLNPAVVVEVLSPSTASFDRGDKWAHFQRLHSLRDYVLVAQDRRRIEIYSRQNDGSWLWREAGSGILELTSIGCSLEVDAVYEGIEFLEENNIQGP